jgi:predicted protein tyrosine phosphatase
VCGVDELLEHRRGVRDVLSILDPERPDPEAFEEFEPHRRLTLRFHDDIEPLPGRQTPQEAHVARILTFGEELAARHDDSTPADRGGLLVHCHMGVSRSTAALLSLMAQVEPAEEPDALFERLVAIRPMAWPNSRMIGFADALLGRSGALTRALARHYARQLAAKPEFDRWMTQLGRQAELAMARRA